MTRSSRPRSREWRLTSAIRRPAHLSSGTPKNANDIAKLSMTLVPKKTPSRRLLQVRRRRRPRAAFLVERQKGLCRQRRNRQRREDAFLSLWLAWAKDFRSSPRPRPRYRPRRITRRKTRTRAEFRFPLSRGQPAAKFRRESRSGPFKTSRTILARRNCAGRFQIYETHVAFDIIIATNL